jgi:hypothetical protein
MRSLPKRSGPELELLTRNIRNGASRRTRLITVEELVQLLPELRGNEAIIRAYCGNVRRRLSGPERADRIVARVLQGLKPEDPAAGS